MIDVRGTTVGVGVDDQRNVTVFLQNGTATLDGHHLHTREACTKDTKGALECADQKGNNIWTVITEGVKDGEPPKENLSNAPNSDDEKGPPKDPTPTSTSNSGGGGRQQPKR